jgi:hypothetical protein
VLSSVAAACRLNRSRNGKITNKGQIRVHPRDPRPTISFWLSFVTCVSFVVVGFEVRLALPISRGSIESRVCCLQLFSRKRARLIREAE